MTLGFGAWGWHLHLLLEFLYFYSSHSPYFFFLLVFLVEKRMERWDLLAGEKV